MPLIRLVINWFALLVSPIWCIPVFLWYVFTDKKDSLTRDIFYSGKRWFWSD